MVSHGFKVVQDFVHPQYQFRSTQKSGLEQSPDINQRVSSLALLCKPNGEYSLVTSTQRKFLSGIVVVAPMQRSDP